MNPAEPSSCSAASRLTLSRPTRRLRAARLLRPFERCEPRDDGDRRPGQTARPGAALLAVQQGLVTVAICRSGQPDEDPGRHQRTSVDRLEEQSAEAKAWRR